MAHSSPLELHQRLPQSTSISSNASTCLEYLEKICHNLLVLTPGEANRVGVERNIALLNFQDAQAKFKAWGVSIAAFRSKSHPTSLDFRLRDAPDIQKRLCQVLKEIQEYLDDCWWCSLVLLQYSLMCHSNSNCVWKEIQRTMGR
jgi:hypothetical protein